MYLLAIKRDIMNDIGEKLGSIEELNIYPECVENYLLVY